jgi:hypothetical protein
MTLRARLAVREVSPADQSFPTRSAFAGEDTFCSRDGNSGGGVELSRAGPDLDMRRNPKEEAHDDAVAPAIRYSMCVPRSSRITAIEQLNAFDAGLLR